MPNLMAVDVQVRLRGGSSKILGQLLAYLSSDIIARNSALLQRATEAHLAKHQSVRTAKRRNISGYR